MMSAHLMIFWFSQVSTISPPVCMTAFAAAGISGGHPMKTGFASLSMGATFYFMPLLFLFSDILAVENNLLMALTDSFLMLSAIFFYVSGMEGFLWKRRSGMIQRILYFVIAGILFASTFKTIDMTCRMALMASAAAGMIISMLIPQTSQTKQS